MGEEGSGAAGKDFPLFPRLGCAWSGEVQGVLPHCSLPSREQECNSHYFPPVPQIEITQVWGKHREQWKSGGCRMNARLSPSPGKISSNGHLRDISSARNERRFLPKDTGFGCYTDIWCDLAGDNLTLLYVILSIH